LPKVRRKEELTIKEIKDMIYKAIEKKKNAVDPDKFNKRIVEDNLTEVKAMQQIYARIIDEELRRKRQQTDQKMK
jgi:ribonuclease HIII